MAGQANPASLIARLAVAVLAAPWIPAPAAPLFLRLDQAASRTAPEYSPTYAGKTVAVKGVVSARAVSFVDYQHMAIQEAGAGLMLEASEGTFERFRAGDLIEAVGKISSRNGLVVLIPAETPHLLIHGTAPPAEKVAPEKLRSMQYLARLVTTEGRVIDMGDSSGGAYLVIGDGRSTYKLFVPYSRQAATTTFPGINIGDLVRATGIASQYCPLPPYNRWFEMVLPSGAAVVRLAGGFAHPWAFVVAFAFALLAVAVWWMRERRLRAQREMLDAVHTIGEEIPGLSSTAEILKRISAALPRLFQVSRVRLYVYNRGSKTLDEVPAETKGHAVSISLDAARIGSEPGAVACLQNCAQLVVPDTSRSPYVARGDDSGSLPRSLLFVPMFVQGEVTGVIEIGRDHGSRSFSHDEQTLAQHLANQTGLAIQLVGQRSVREQLFRTEKLAAVGRLISGVVNELQAPLATISKMARSVLAEEPYSAVDRELRVIASESVKASEIVTRLVSFAGGDQVEAKPVEINGLLRSLIEFREREWKVRGIRVRNLLADRTIVVMGSQGQLEQVFLNLLVHAEQSMAEIDEKQIVLRTSVLARRVLIEIGYRSLGESTEDPFSKWSENSSGALGLGVCRSIISGHSGEVRLVNTQGSESRFEVELPWAGADNTIVRTAEPGRSRSRVRTAMLLEPDEPSQRQLLTMLSSRGYRVVPAQTPEIGLDLAQRLRFDIVLCSIRLPGLNWVELSEHFQPLVDAFVLISEAYDPDLVISFERARRFVLSKPIDAVQLDRVLAFAENPPSRRELIAG
jgi:signal transduction histidine kinase